MEASTKSVGHLFLEVFVKQHLENAGLSDIQVAGEVLVSPRRITLGCLFIDSLSEISNQDCNRYLTTHPSLLLQWFKKVLLGGDYILCEELGYNSFFISSKMLELLDLAHEAQKGKIGEREPTKAERFNLIFNKLKERNADNEAFIRKYIKQASKRREKITERKSSYQEEEDHNKQDKKQVSLKKSSSNERMKPIEEIKMSGSLNRLVQDTVKQCLLKRTNHTEEAFDDQNKVSSFPVINYLTVVHKSEHQTTDFKPIFQQNRDFKNHCKNITKEKQAKKIVLEMSDSANTQDASTIRLKTDFGGKFHLSIKSLIFGSQQLNSDKTNAQSIKNSIFTAQASDNPHKKREKDCHFYDDKLVKGILPTLNIHSTPKHHQFLQNYIKLNPDKLNKYRCTIKPNPIQPQQSKRVNSSRNVVSFRINTIQIKKQF